MSATKWPKKGFDDPSWDIQVWPVGSRALALGYLDLLGLVGKRVQYLLKGMLLTWAPGSILTITSFVPSLVGSWSQVKKAIWPLDALSINREPLGHWSMVSMLLARMMLIESWWYLWGVCQQLSWWDQQGNVLWLGLLLGLWEVLWLGLWWQHDCLLGDLPECLPLFLLTFLWRLFDLFMECWDTAWVSCFSAYKGHCSDLSHCRCSNVGHMQEIYWGNAYNHTYCSRLGCLGHQCGWRLLKQWRLIWTWGWLFPSPWPFCTACTLIPALCSGREGTGRWSCWHIHSLASCKCTACCQSMIFSISWVWTWGNFVLCNEVTICWDSTWIPSLGCCLTSESSSSLCVQRCSSALIVVPMASRVFSCSPQLWSHCL